MSQGTRGFVVSFSHKKGLDRVSGQFKRVNRAEKGQEKGITPKRDQKSSIFRVSGLFHGVL